MYKYASTYKDGSLPKERTMILYYENRIGKRFDLAELYTNQEGKYRVAKFLFKGYRLADHMRNWYDQYFHASRDNITATHYPYLCTEIDTGARFIPTMIDYCNNMAYQQIGQASDSGRWHSFNDILIQKITSFVDLAMGDVNPSTDYKNADRIPTPSGYFYL